MKSAFLLSNRLLCLCDKQNNIWLFVDKEFLSFIELNNLREIPYLRVPMYYSLFIIQLHWEQITCESSTVYGQLIILYCKKNLFNRSATRAAPLYLLRFSRLVRDASEI